MIEGVCDVCGVKAGVHDETVVASMHSDSVQELLCDATIVQRTHKMVMSLMIQSVVSHLLVKPACIVNHTHHN